MENREETNTVNILECGVENGLNHVRALSVDGIVVEPCPSNQMATFVTSQFEGTVACQVAENAAVVQGSQGKGLALAIEYAGDIWVIIIQFVQVAKSEDVGRGLGVDRL